MAGGAARARPAVPLAGSRLVPAAGIGPPPAWLLLEPGIDPLVVRLHGVLAVAAAGGRRRPRRRELARHLGCSLEDLEAAVMLLEASGRDPLPPRQRRSW